MKGGVEMLNETVYAVLHIPTGHFMPEPTGHSGRGGSYWDPVKPAKKARLFRFERSAKAAITQWCRGTHTAEFDWDTDCYSGKAYQYQIGTSVIPVPGRNRADLRVVELNLVPKL